MLFSFNVSKCPSGSSCFIIVLSLQACTIMNADFLRKRKFFIKKRKRNFGERLRRRMKLTTLYVTVRHTKVNSGHALTTYMLFKLLVLWRAWKLRWIFRRNELKRRTAKINMHLSRKGFATKSRPASLIFWASRAINKWFWSCAFVNR